VPSIVTALRNGTRTFTDPALNHVNCDFVADYSPSASLNAQPVFHANGTLGQPGFNVDFDGGTLVRVASEQPCPSNSGPIVTGVHVSSDQNITIGSLSHGGRIVISVGSTNFTSDHGFIEFTLTSFDSSTHRATGTFQVLTTSDNPGDARVLIVRNGSFSMPF
jgi:hypothetical protein